MRALVLPALVVLVVPALAAAEPPAEQEVGARLGARLNLGGLGNGGVQLGGAFLYRLTERVWFDTQVGVSIGGKTRDCYLARSLDVTCDPSLASGAGVMVSGGPRWFFDEIAGLTPHVGGGLAVGYVSHSADDLTGIAFPVWLSGGARAPLRDGLSLGGELVFAAGPAHLSRDQGWTPVVSLSLVGTIDFEL